MRVEIARHALDRVPLSIIFDDSTLLVNLNYFFMRDRNLVDGENRRWEDVPVVHPESFTREFAEWCLEHGVKGKYSIVPCPAALGRIDEGLPMFSRAQQEDWLAMCRELITPNFDITPEMITHTVVVDPDTCQPLPEGIWEQYEWQTLPVDEEERVFRYISRACEILVNVGLPPAGVTSPGGFGGNTLEFYARVAGAAVRAVTGEPLPYFFKRSAGNLYIEVPVWHGDRKRGEATGEIIASTQDWTGSWTGYGEVNADRYIEADLQGGRLPELIDAEQPVVLCSHWQGFYGMHDEDRAGYNAFKQVVARLAERDPRGEYTRWRTCSEITRYACMREMAGVAVAGAAVVLDLPVQVPELTLRIADANVAGVSVAGTPLRKVGTRADFQTGTFWVADGGAWAAFDPQGAQVSIEIQVRGE